MNKKMQPTTFGKLAIRLLVDHDIIADDFRRTYVGCNQKAGGAWLWSARLGDGPYHIGSVHPASVLVRAKKLGIIGYDFDAHDLEVIPLESEEEV